MKHKKLLLLLPLLGLTSCAGAFDGSLESVTVQTTSNGAPVVQVQCTLSDNKGEWFVSTPGSVAVHRGSEPLRVTCAKDGFSQVTDMEPSSTNMSAILLQGAIMSTVSGSAWSYPQIITVAMQPAPAAVATP